VLACEVCAADALVSCLSLEVATSSSSSSTEAGWEGLCTRHGDDGSSNDTFVFQRRDAGAKKRSDGGHAYI